MERNPQPGLLQQFGNGLDSLTKGMANKFGWGGQTKDSELLLYFTSITSSIIDCSESKNCPLVLVNCQFSAEFLSLFVFIQFVDHHPNSSNCYWETNWISSALSDYRPHFIRHCGKRKFMFVQYFPNDDFIPREDIDHCRYSSSNWSRSWSSQRE